MTTPAARPDSVEAVRDALTADPFAPAGGHREPGDRDVCKPLIQALKDPLDLVRRAAVGALIALDVFCTATPIMWVLLHGSVPARTAAAEVLGEIAKGDPLAVQDLSKALNDSATGIRLAVALSLETVCRWEPESAGTLPRPVESRPKGRPGSRKQGEITCSPARFAARSTTNRSLRPARTGNPRIDECSIRFID